MGVAAKANARPVTRLSCRMTTVTVSASFSFTWAEVRANASQVKLRAFCHDFHELYRMGTTDPQS